MNITMRHLKLILFWLVTIEDVVHAWFFEPKLSVHSFQKKKRTTIPATKGWSQTINGNSTPTRSGFKNKFPSEKKRGGPFLPNKLTANNSFDR